MAPNRSRSNSNAYQYQNRSNSPNVQRGQPSRNGYRQPVQQTPNVQSPVQSSPARQQQGKMIPGRLSAAPKDLGMSPASRYKHNLKVLRRHDPTIASIFDQFSHVCLYTHNGVKWEKKGYEGSMFLFEREEHPKYGFFILNRMGMDDYIQSISPMDDMEISDEYLMYRSHAPYSPAHRHTPSQGDVGSSQGQKGNSEIIGLWMFATDAREPMNVVMMRLYSYVRKNLRYPDQFRYGPGKKPPPNPNAIGQRQTDGEEEESGETSMDISDIEDQGRRRVPQNSVKPVEHQRQSEAAQPMGMSELDMLFAKLAPTSAPSLSPVAPQASASLNIMDMLSGRLSKPTKPTSQSQPQSSPPAPSENATRGLALLDSIFASVTPTLSPPETSLVGTKPNSSAMGSAFPPPPSAPPSTRLVHMEAHSLGNGGGDYHGSANTSTSALEIHSPKPSTAALPQILTADVIHELMGLPTPAASSISRSASAASVSSVYPTSGPESPHARMGGEKQKQRTRRRHKGGYVADQGEDEDGAEVAPVGLDAHGPRAARGYGGAQTMAGSASPFLSVTESSSGHGSLKGDATPRARPGRGLEPEQLGGPVHTSTPPPPERSPARRRQKQEANLRGASVSMSTESGVAKASQTPPRMPFQAGSELWPLPRDSLIDDRSFDSAGTMLGAVGAVQGEVELEEDVVELDFSEIGVLSDLRAFEARARANGKSVMQVQVNGTGVKEEEKRKQKQAKKEKQKSAEAVGESFDMATSPRIGVASAPMVNGAGKGETGASQKGKAKDQLETPVAPELARQVLLGELSRTGISAKPMLERNDFVREVLTLIHTDKSFVDRLYQGYLSMA